MRDQRYLLRESEALSTDLELRHNVKFLLEGAPLGKEFLHQLDTFPLLFNMHALLEQLKMQKKDSIVSNCSHRPLLAIFSEYAGPAAVHMST